MIKVSDEIKITQRAKDCENGKGGREVTGPGV